MNIRWIITVLGIVLFSSLPGMLETHANNVGTNRQSCKKGFFWHYKMAKCIPSTEANRKLKNPRVFTE